LTAVARVLTIFDRPVAGCLMPAGLGPLPGTMGLHFGADFFDIELTFLSGLSKATAIHSIAWSRAVCFGASSRRTEQIDEARSDSLGAY
jgi:hypothetical protein